MEGDCKDSNDVCDLFGNIMLLEDKVSSVSFHHGYEKGILEGHLEGFHLGYHRGCELGYEIGFYIGFRQCVESLIKVSGYSHSERLVDALVKFKKLLQEFPKTNETDSDVVLLRDDIRVRFKQICSILKIEPIIPVEDKLSY